MPKNLPIIDEEDDLDALPIGSIIRDEDGDVHLRVPGGWHTTGRCKPAHYDVDVPVELVYGGDDTDG